MSAIRRLDSVAESLATDDEDAAWEDLREAEVNFREFVRCAFRWREGFIDVMTPERQEELCKVAEQLRRAGMALEYPLEAVELIDGPSVRN